ncbi:MAG: FMN-binding negative transcriptional regulator [Gammaproteobacteria bacterium]|jgi:transcriptional regulator
MYSPPHFTETDAAALCALIVENNFAVLVSSVEGRTFGTHLPFLYRAESAMLTAHMARANPHWQALAAAPEQALVIFQGPHEYVSPTWYGEPGVPTWNYAAVHVYGSFELIEDPAEHRHVLDALTAHHEAGNMPPWRADFDAPPIAGMLRGTVAFNIRITALEGKFKLNQNRSAADRSRVIDALEAGGGDNARGVARLMRERQ